MFSNNFSEYTDIWNADHIFNPMVAAAESLMLWCGQLELTGGQIPLVCSSHRTLWILHVHVVIYSGRSPYWVSIYLLPPVTCSRSICTPRYENLSLQKRCFSRGVVQYFLSWQLSFHCMGLHINALNHHHTHSSYHLQLSLTTSHKYMEEEDAVRQGYIKKSVSW